MMTMEQDVALKVRPFDPDTRLCNEAEKELAAFLSAVSAVRGEQHVNTAAEHWMQALEDGCLPSFVTRGCFHTVSLAAAVSMSHQLSPNGLRTSNC